MSRKTEIKIVLENDNIIWSSHTSTRTNLNKETLVRCMSFRGTGDR